MCHSLVMMCCAMIFNNHLQPYCGGITLFFLHKNEKKASSISNPFIIGLAKPYTRQESVPLIIM